MPLLAPPPPTQLPRPPHVACREQGAGDAAAVRLGLAAALLAAEPAALGLRPVEPAAALALALAGEPAALGLADTVEPTAPGLTVAAEPAALGLAVATPLAVDDAACDGAMLPLGLEVGAAL